MTEVTNSTATSNKKAGKGLTISRLFTTAGVHPYDEVTWERRDVMQTNWKTGDIVFEQRNCEFPESWSVNASTIVTTKYFRGAVGSEQREMMARITLQRERITHLLELARLGRRSSGAGPAAPGRRPGDGAGAQNV